MFRYKTKVLVQDKQAPLLVFLLYRAIESQGLLSNSLEANDSGAEVL
jgi:hypothetical protein